MPPRLQSEISLHLKRIQEAFTEDKNIYAYSYSLNPNYHPSCFVTNHIKNIQRETGHYDGSFRLSVAIQVSQ